MDPTIITALIGATATIVAALIARRAGKKRGVEEGMKDGIEKGREHSLLRFMDEQEKQLAGAMSAIERQDYSDLEAKATAIVDTVMIWRRIQENFQALLNGRVSDLAGILKQGKPENLVTSIRALHDGFAARRLAVETELRKSTI